MSSIGSFSVVTLDEAGVPFKSGAVEPEFRRTGDIKLPVDVIHLLDRLRRDYSGVVDLAFLIPEV